MDCIYVIFLQIIFKLNNNCFSRKLKQAAVNKLIQMKLRLSTL